MLNLLNLFSLKRSPLLSQFHILLIYVLPFQVLHFHVLQFHALHIGPSISRPSFSRPAFSAPPLSPVRPSVRLSVTRVDQSKTLEEDHATFTIE